ncbi:MAG: polysaccharide deacetylase family protein [Ignavibacteriaceae bacterium]|nr:polysaccharide deacetylase family protein [Ignavibacteriaceae bacterium]
MNLKFLLKSNFLSILIQLFVLMLIANSISISQSFSVDSVKVRVAKWSDDKQSAFSFSFDDGLLSHYQNAKPILDQFGFKGTFNVMPPLLADSLPGIWRYGTWPMFIELSQDGHEIASHTMNHDTLTILPVGDTMTEGTAIYELYQSKKEIEQRIPDKKCNTLAYPYSYRNQLVDSLTSLFYEAGRSDGEEPNHYSLDYFYDLNSYAVHFNLPRNTLADDLDELYSFMNWIHNSILNEAWAIMMIHEIVPQLELPDLVSEGLYEPISNEWFTYLCDSIKARSENKEIWVETTGNIVRYMKQRDSCEYQVISSAQDEIEIELTDNLDDEIYNYPLSAYVTIPEDWNYILFTQAGRIDTLTAIATDSGKVVLCKIIPDDGIMTLTKLNITGIDDEKDQPLSFELYQNYPNPFNPSTRIRYSVMSNVKRQTSKVTLKVYDMLGVEIATLVNEEKPAGTYEVEFNGSRLSSGVSAKGGYASGVYFYQLRVGEFVQTRKMILAK